MRLSASRLYAPEHLDCAGRRRGRAVRARLDVGVDEQLQGQVVRPRPLHVPTRQSIAESAVNGWYTRPRPVCPQQK
jgi:hypothetical protein